MTVQSDSFITQYHIELIRPSQYDDDGYVIQWQQAYTPANSLACLNGLFQDLSRKNILGDGTDISVNTYDESHLNIPIRDIVARFTEPNSTGLVVLAGVQTCQFPRALDLAKQFRKYKVAVAIGGFHVSGCMAMLDDLDPSLEQAMKIGVSLFVGEAEDRLTEILLDLHDGGLKTIYSSPSSLPQLESQPYPYLPGEAINAYADSVATCDTGRGCPYRCNFCTIINVQGRKSRSRNIKDIEQMVRYNAAQGVNRLFLTDDNFSRCVNWEEILDLLIDLRQTDKIELNLTLQVDTLCHKLPGFVEKAAQAGCSSVFIGLETININNLRLVGKKQNRIIEYQALLQAWRNVGVLTYAGYIIGFPNDTAESVARDIRTIQSELLIDILEFFILTPLPGSELHRDMILNGIELETDLNKYDLSHVTMAHPLLSTEELEGLYRNVWDWYYSPEHIETLMRRAVASNIDPRRIQHAIYRFYGAISIEGVHPLQAGSTRMKCYSQRRSGNYYPNPVSFYLKNRLDVYNKKRKRKRLFNNIHNILNKVINDPKSLACQNKTFTDSSSELRVMGK